MSNILEQAKLFFDACETGKGWEACSPYCHPQATFSAQAGARWQTSIRWQAIASG